MSQRLLERILTEIRTDDDRLREWMPHDLRGFSEFPKEEKNLFAYQQKAFLNAAKGLMLYYGEPKMDISISERKQNFMRKYSDLHVNAISEFCIGKNHAAFPIYKKYLRGCIQDDNVQGWAFSNRMGFWMATGSGKTLVIVKLIDYLLDMMSDKKGMLPHGNILVLAPSSHAIAQIQKTANEYNSDYRRMDIHPLREFNSKRSGNLWKSGAGVYFCRSDLLTESQKDKQLDWKDFDNNGNWYVLLDEAHKGGRQESTRKAYATLMARNRFLFNFSATLTDESDILSTAYSHNLSQFIHSGSGKKIRLAENCFQDVDELTPEARQMLVLESLLALTVARRAARNLRKQSGCNEMYHIPMMMAIANTAQTEDNNDLANFFNVVCQIAADQIKSKMYNEAWGNYVNNWSGGDIYGSLDSNSDSGNAARLKKPSIEDMRMEIFGSPKRGGIKYMTPLKGEAEITVKNWHLPALRRLRHLH